MSENKFNFIAGVTRGLEAIAVAVVTYCVAENNPEGAAAINSAIVVGVEIVLDFLHRYVK